MERITPYTIEANLVMDEVKANFGNIRKQEGARIINLRIGGHTVLINLNEGNQIVKSISKCIKETTKFSELMSTVDEIRCALDGMVSTIQSFKQDPVAYSETSDPDDIGDNLENDLSSYRSDLEDAINQL
jgi:hypothetical protein